VSIINEPPITISGLPEAINYQSKRGFRDAELARPVRDSAARRAVERLVFWIADREAGTDRRSDP